MRMLYTAVSMQLTIVEIRDKHRIKLLDYVKYLEWDINYLAIALFCVFLIRFCWWHKMHLIKISVKNFEMHFRWLNAEIIHCQRNLAAYQIFSKWTLSGCVCVCILLPFLALSKSVLFFYDSILTIWWKLFVHSRLTANN